MKKFLKTSALQIAVVLCVVMVISYSLIICKEQKNAAEALEWKDYGSAVVTGQDGKSAFTLFWVDSANEIRMDKTGKIMEIVTPEGVVAMQLVLTKQCKVEFERTVETTFNRRAWIHDVVGGADLYWTDLKNVGLEGIQLAAIPQTYDGVQVSMDVFMVANANGTLPKEQCDLSYFYGDTEVDSLDDQINDGDVTQDDLLVEYQDRDAMTFYSGLKVSLNGDEVIPLSVNPEEHAVVYDYSANDKSRLSGGLELLEFDQKGDPKESEGAANRVYLNRFDQSYGSTGVTSVVESYQSGYLIRGSMSGEVAYAFVMDGVNQYPMMLIYKPALSNEVINGEQLRAEKTVESLVQCLLGSDVKEDETTGLTGGVVNLVDPYDDSDKPEGFEYTPEAAPLNENEHEVEGWSEMYDCKAFTTLKREGVTVQVNWLPVEQGLLNILAGESSSYAVYDQVRAFEKERTKVGLIVLMEGKSSQYGVTNYWCVSTNTETYWLSVFVDEGKGQIDTETMQDLIHELYGD